MERFKHLIVMGWIYHNYQRRRMDEWMGLLSWQYAVKFVGKVMLDQRMLRIIANL